MARYKQIPNLLTLLRFFLVPFIVLFFIKNEELPFLTEKMYVGLSFFCFLLASLTDFLDGYLARKWNVVSNFGKFLDPIVDKILILGVWLAFVEKGYSSSFVPFVMLLREFAVTGMRMMASQQGEVLSAGLWGKLKMVLQILASCLIYLYVLSLPLPLMLVDFSVWCMVGITLFSGLDYLWQGRKYLLL